MASTLAVILSIVVQLVFYILILAYLWFCYPKKSAYPAKQKLKNDVVIIKRLRTPSEKIKDWMALADFRIGPEPDVELGFPPVRTACAENLETPRLAGAAVMTKPVIAPDDVVERPNVVPNEHSEASCTSGSSSSSESSSSSSSKEQHVSPSPFSENREPT